MALSGPRNTLTRAGPQGSGELPSMLPPAGAGRLGRAIRGSTFPIHTGSPSLGITDPTPPRRFLYRFDLDLTRIPPGPVKKLTLKIFAQDFAKPSLRKSLELKIARGRWTMAGSGRRAGKGQRTPRGSLRPWERVRVATR